MGGKRKKNYYPKKRKSLTQKDGAQKGLTAMNRGRSEPAATPASEEMIKEESEEEVEAQPEVPERGERVRRLN